ncbi:tumor necrosis factor receptor superfamily member 6 [Boleophthalmus pectinirostris]|uniref:tumor necrosis factor receptor superfamily member 6 n=1 Tax=Boleophthalmus pectinirostris TaxID=150288 RepID=UPI00242E22A7|nr:tumor necrosis factor receptor superfamily member 6 [Boleophthalmus pectinirostris]
MFLYVVLAVCMLASQTEEGRVRVRRQGCRYDTYSYEERFCCKCGPGFRVKEHCTIQSETDCVPCITGKEYQSQPNQEKTCEPCTSCEHPHANLVVDRQCTPSVDSTCKCKENHYCSSGAESCKTCEPCQSCSEGIKVACSATNNTICNDKPQGNTVAIVLGTMGGIAVIFAVALLLYFKKKRKPERNNILNVNENEPEQSTHLLGSLGPHIPKVAEVIGWPNMRNLAMQSQISKGRIESCEQDHPTSSVERTIALMRIWEEKESRKSSEKLVQYLRQIHQNSTAEQVQSILSVDSS